MKKFAEGFGIGAALIVALGAVSLLIRPGLLGFGNLRPAPRTRPASRARATDTRPAPPPSDFLDVCRSAGL